MIVTLIRKIARDKGMTISELCQRAGIPVSTFYKMLENDQDNIKLSNLMKFAEALDIHPCKLIDNTFKEFSKSKILASDEYVLIKKEVELLRELLAEKDKRLKMFERIAE